MIDAGLARGVLRLRRVPDSDHLHKQSIARAE